MDGKVSKQFEGRLKSWGYGGHRHFEMAGDRYGRVVLFTCRFCIHTSS